MKLWCLYFKAGTTLKKESSGKKREEEEEKGGEREKVGKEDGGNKGAEL